MGAGRVGRLSFFFWSSFGVLTAWWSWACSLGANVPPVPWSFQLGLLSPCSPLTWLGSQVGAQKQFSAGLFPSHFTQSALQLCSDCSWENSDLKDVLAQSQAESSERAGCELQSSPDCCSTERWWLITELSVSVTARGWAGQTKGNQHRWPVLAFSAIEILVNLPARRKHGSLACDASLADPAPMQPVRTIEVGVGVVTQCMIRAQKKQKHLLVFDTHIITDSYFSNWVIHPVIPFFTLNLVLCLWCACSWHAPLASAQRELVLWRCGKKSSDVLLRVGLSAAQSATEEMCCMIFTITGPSRPCFPDVQLLCFKMTKYMKTSKQGGCAVCVSVPCCSIAEPVRIFLLAFSMLHPYLPFQKSSDLFYSLSLTGSLSCDFLLIWHNFYFVMQLVLLCYFFITSIFLLVSLLHPLCSEERSGCMESEHNWLPSKEAVNVQPGMLMLEGFLLWLTAPLISRRYSCSLPHTDGSLLRLITAFEGAVMQFRSCVSSEMGCFWE